MNRALAAALLVVLAPSLAWAQGAVQQSGPITPGHLSSWTSDHLIGDAGFSTFPAAAGTGVSNNAALKAVSNPAAGTWMQRAGFNTAGDGGAALYVFSTSPCTLGAGAGDNGSQVAPSGSVGCWIASFPAAGADARVWGVVPDNVTDSTAAAQAALNWANTTGGRMLLPCGTTYISSPLSALAPVRGSVNISGCGMDSTFLRSAPGQNGIVLTKSAGDPFASFHVRDMSFAAGGSNLGIGLSYRQTGVIVDASVTGQSDVTNVAFHGSDGYAGSNCWNSSFLTDYVANINFYNDSFTGCTNAASFTGSISGTTMTVTAIASGQLLVGQLINGAGVTQGTTIISQISGTNGGTGTYGVNNSQTVTSEAMTTSYLGTGIYLYGAGDANHSGVIYNVQSSAFSRLYSGLSIGAGAAAGWIQGVTANQSNFNENIYGINVQQYSPAITQLNATNSQFGYSWQMISLGGTPAPTNILNNVFTIPWANETALFASGPQGLVFSGNACYGYTTTMTTCANIVGPNAGANAGGVISNNYITNLNTGISLTSPVQGFKVSGNVFPSTIVPIANTTVGAASNTNGNFITGIKLLYTGTTGAASNGAATPLTRLAVTSTTGFENGDVVSVYGVGGIVAGMISSINVIDATHVDLLDLAWGGGTYTTAGIIAKLP